MGEEAEPDSSSDEKPKGQSGSLRRIIVSSAFTLLGIGIGAALTGYYNLRIEKQKYRAELRLEDKKVTAELNLEEKKFEESKHLERQKLDADLVKLALQSSGVDGAKTLGFMVQAHLIEDQEIRDGINRYLASNSTVPILQAHGNDDFPWNAKDIITITAPHGGPFAFASTEGIVQLQTTIQTQTGTDPGYILDQSEIKSPTAYFSQNGEALFVYNKQKAAIYFTQLDTIRGEQRFRPAIRISPPDGISEIWLSEDGKAIGVTGFDKQRVSYDLDGNEIKQ